MPSDIHSSSNNLENLPFELLKKNCERKSKPELQRSLMKGVLSLIFIYCQILSALENPIRDSSQMEKAIELKTFTTLPAEKFSFLSDYKIILVGEIHGTNESPEFALGLVQYLSDLKQPVVLAIEVWDSEQGVIDEFMKTGEVELLKNAPFFKNTPQYGIGSQAMVKLLQQLRNIPNVQVFCFDSLSPDTPVSTLEERIRLSQDRDLQMAKRLTQKFAENEKAKMVVLTGSLHASTQINSIAGIDYQPMGYHLSHLKNVGVLSIHLQFEQGSSWGGFSENGVDITYGIHEMTSIKDHKSQTTDWDNYFLPLNHKEEGYNAIFFTKKITPSSPLVEP